MREIRAGELLRKFRNEKRISARSLSKGICAASAIANYESGERVCDVILLERFLERMGIVSSNFALMLQEEEYDYYLWREHCYHAVEKAEWENVAQLLEAEVGMRLVGNSKVQEQVYLYMKAILLAERDGKYAKASALLFEAAHKTIPDIFHIRKDKVCLGELEIQIILLYLYYGLLGDVILSEEADFLFQELHLYCGREYVEDGVKTKTYVRIACLWMKYGNPQMDDARKIELCENALKYLRGHQFFFDITGLLEIYIPLLEAKQSSELPFYKKQYEAFIAIMEYAGVDTRFRPEIMGTQSPCLYLISEYLQYKRREKKLTQERASEGICEPETYSRLENGVRSPSPTNMIALLERLDIGWHFYRGELDTDNRKVYGLDKKEQVAVTKDKWKDCLDILNEMKKLLNMDLSVNQQYLYAKETKIRHSMGSIGTQEAYEQDLKWLSLTTEVDLQQKNIVYYSNTELDIIGHMGQLLRKMNRNTEAIQLLETVLHQMSQSNVDSIFHFNGRNFVTRVLSGLYFSVGKYEKAYEVEYRIYEESIRYYNGGNLVTMLDSMSDSLEHIGIQHSEEYKKLCRLAYYVADFYDNQSDKEFLQGYYDKNYEQGYIWYPI